MALGAILDIDSTAKIVVVTGRAEREYRRNALAKGAYDFFSKPYDLDELKIVLLRAHYLFTLEEEHRYLGRCAQGESLPQMLGTSQSMQEVFAIHFRSRLCRARSNVDNSRRLC